MKITLKIEGMMCPHCEARVQSVLQAVEGVNDASASHEKASAIVDAQDGITYDMLKDIVEKEGYKVVG